MSWKKLTGPPSDVVSSTHGSGNYGGAPGLTANVSAAAAPNHGGGEIHTEIDGVVYSYRCDMCYEPLDDTEMQFRPCARCHLQICLFCFDKHTNASRSRQQQFASCPKCSEPIDLERIMSGQRNDANNTVTRKLLSHKAQSQSHQSQSVHKAKESQSHTQTQSPNTSTAKNSNSDANSKRKRRDRRKDDEHCEFQQMNIDEEVGKGDWRDYLKGRFISRDSIIVAPVIAKFNNEEAISDNFRAYGRITRINMWDDESAHIMYDKQYYADTLVEKIQDVAVRYCGQFGLMSAKYHFRRPCEEFMDPSRRCPMQCRKFHGPYYKMDFIPLATYLDEMLRARWIADRRRQVAHIVRARYRKFRRKFMDNAPLPCDTQQEQHRRPGRNEYSVTKGVGADGHSSYYHHYSRGDGLHGTAHRPSTSTKVMLKKSHSSLVKSKHRLRPNQPPPPSRAPPSPPLHSFAVMAEETETTSVTSGSTRSNSSHSSLCVNLNLSKRTRPPLHHTTSAQMRPFLSEIGGPMMRSKSDPNANRSYASLVSSGSQQSSKDLLLSLKHKKERKRMTTVPLNSLRPSKPPNLSLVHPTHPTQTSTQRFRPLSNAIERIDRWSTPTSRHHRVPGVPVAPVAPPRSRNLRPRVRSKLNASAPVFEYVPPTKLTSKLQNLEDTKDTSTSKPKSSFKLPKIGQNTNRNLRDFDIRNLGPLMADDILAARNANDYAYDFGAALNESHLDLEASPNVDVPTPLIEPEEIKTAQVISGLDDVLEPVDSVLLSQMEDTKHLPPGPPGSMATLTAVTSQTLPTEFETAEPLETVLWRRVEGMMKNSPRAAQLEWHSVRRQLKSTVTANEWSTLKERGKLRRIKLRFHAEFESESESESETELERTQTGHSVDVHSDRSGLNSLLERDSLRTAEAKALGDLQFSACSAMDVEVRMGEIRSAMTALLTSSSVRRRDSPYNNLIIAELGQLLNAYQVWMDHKISEEMHEVAEAAEIESIEQHREIEIDAKTMSSTKGSTADDFYSRLLDEVQQKALEDEHENDEQDFVTPRHLVMDYLADSVVEDVVTGTVDVQIEEEVKMDAETIYDYEVSDEESEREVQRVEVSSSKRKRMSPPRQPPQPQPQVSEVSEVTDVQVTHTQPIREPMDAIFSRVMEPPPRHQMQRQMETQSLQSNQSSSWNGMNEMEFGERHYYNARYPPRRGRFGQNDNGYAGDVVRQSGYRSRTAYGSHTPTAGGGGHGGGVKMEWKKKNRSAVHGGI